MRVAAGLLVAAVALLAAAPRPARPAGPESLEGRLDAVLSRPEVAALRVGVSVRDASGAEVYGRNAEEPLALASNTKLLTTAAALARLGPDHLLEVELGLRGEVHGGVLEGALVVVGRGDPEVSGRRHGGEATAVLRDLARGVVEAGVTRVRGGLVVDDRWFDAEWTAPGWPADQLQEWYEAPVGALVLNDSCVDVEVRPGAAPGRPALVGLMPPQAPVRVVNRCLTTARRKEHRIALRRSLEGGTAITVSGRCWVSAAPAVDHVAVADPGLYFGEVLRTVLGESGVALEGTVRRAGADEDLSGARVVARHATPVAVAVEVANRRSQNLYAEVLLKTLGRVVHGEGSFAAGSRAVSDYLRELGIEGAELADGSGLSRACRAPASALTRLLAVAVARPLAGFVESLPRSGEPGGSLARRLADGECAGRVRAKTGTIAGVSTLSGYARSRGGQDYAFSVLVNATGGRTALARSIQDQVARALVEADP